MEVESMPFPGRRVVVGSDDLYPAVEAVIKYLKEKGFEVVLVGSPKTGKPEPGL